MVFKEEKKNLKITIIFNILELLVIASTYYKNFTLIA